MTDHNERSDAIAAEEAAETIDEKAGRVFTPKVRAWAYGVVGAVCPLLVTTGVITGTVAGHIVAIAASVLAVGTSGLALANLSKK
jgi:hypothetical protein